MWIEKERRFLDRSPWDPLVQEFLERANYGQEDEVDTQGRVLVPAHLREMLGFAGEVLESGRGDFFAVVPRERARYKVTSDFTSEQWAALAALERE